MFIQEDNVNNFKDLFAEVKKYLMLQKEFTKIELTEKLAVLLSSLIMGSIILAMSTIAVLYLSFAMAYKLADYVGGMGTSLTIMAAVLLIFLLIIYLSRRSLIINPVVNFLAKLFLNDSK